jgi:hypothetical protein
VEYQELLQKEKEKQLTGNGCLLQAVNKHPIATPPKLTSTKDDYNYIVSTAFVFHNVLLDVF